MNARWSLVLVWILSAATAKAGCGPMPPILPLNGFADGGTCGANQNEACNDVQYPNPTATARFTLDTPSTMSIAISGGTAGFMPIGYLSGGVCDDGPCLPHLPAGSYCLTVTASPENAEGACGCFHVNVETIPDDIDTIYAGDFE